MARRASRKKHSGNAIRGLPEKVGAAFGASALYQALLDGPVPERIYYAPRDIRRRDADFGEQIAKGAIRLGGADLSAASGKKLRDIWEAVSPDAPAYAPLHGFDWLRHLAPLRAEGRAAALELADGWLARYGKWSPQAWLPEITATRIFNWISHHGLILKNRELVWRSKAMSSLARQTRHLARTAHRAPDGAARLETAARLAIAGACLPNFDQALERGLEILRREFRLQVLPDGGHVSRNPSDQLRIVAALAAIQECLEARNKPIPVFLRHAIDKTAPMTRFFRHGDGGLALFNGSCSDDIEAIRAVLARDDVHAKPFGFAPHLGFQRIRASRSRLFVDVAPPRMAASQAHNGLFSFEFSAMRSRIIVNCGDGAHLGGDWGRAMRLSQAHSTLIAPAFETAAGPIKAESRRFEDRTGYWIDAMRQTDSGARHRRRFFLSADGDDLRGEDRFRGAGPDDEEFVIRFHLHPTIRASLARDGKSVLIICPDGDCWRFRSDARAIAIEDSVYVDRPMNPRKCDQIVIRSSDAGVASDQAVKLVKWVLRRESRAAAPTA